jgi:mono/diheme cytochrome c family protein
MKRGAIALISLCWAVLGGCDDMVDQPKQRAYAPLVGPAGVPSGTVEYDSAPDSTPLEVPPVTRALLERGQERYRIYCTPCHSELGDGHGMIVERGFPAPPSYHIDRLREASPQYFYDVITHGHGAMYSFADRVQPRDRWAIAAYIRALQRSQRASLSDVPAPERGSLQ